MGCFEEKNGSSINSYCKRGHSKIITMSSEHSFRFHCLYAKTVVHNRAMISSEVHKTRRYTPKNDSVNFRQGWSEHLQSKLLTCKNKIDFSSLVQKT